jgi:hypothetical protein
MHPPPPPTPITGIEVVALIVLYSRTTEERMMWNQSLFRGYLEAQNHSGGPFLFFSPFPTYVCCLAIYTDSVPFCTILYHPVPSCIMLYHSVPFCIILYYHTVPPCIILYHSVSSYTTWHNRFLDLCAA